MGVAGVSGNATCELIRKPPSGARYRVALMVASTSTLQDSQGFVWLGTEDGLVRYDVEPDVAFNICLLQSRNRAWHANGLLDYSGVVF